MAKELSFQSKMENWEEGMDYCAIPVPSITSASVRKSGLKRVSRKGTESRYASRSWTETRTRRFRKISRKPSAEREC